MINVTKPYLPEKEKYEKYVEEIFASGWITNNGPKVKELERRLEQHLNVKNLVLVSSGTIALEIAYRTLDLKGSGITSPCSFVATTSSLLTNNLMPTFADIDKDTLNLDPKNIAKLIGEDTSVILPVHLFGNACEVEEIAKIAKKNDLKVIYDAAHAFDVKYKGESILKYGEISTLSFHATKIFHTIEGGALIINNDELAQKARYLINFGIKNSDTIPYLGTNAKMNEFEAAMGLCLLDDFEKIKDKRKQLVKIYKTELKNLVNFQKQNVKASENFSYMPIVLNSEKELLGILRSSEKQNIYPRRYCYPSLDTLSFIGKKQNAPISRNISKRILCLPMSHSLTESEQDIILNIVKKQCMK